ncbi:MAG: hypothetical protein AAFY60_15220, partial [Myxococcota bacterium]
MSDIESQTVRVSSPSSSLEASAFGAEAYNPKAYGAMQGSGHEPHYPLETNRRKTLAEVSSEAQVGLFVGKDRRLPRQVAIAAAALIAAGVVVVTYVALSGSESSTASEETIAVVAQVPTDSTPDVETTDEPIAVEADAADTATDSRPEAGLEAEAESDVESEVETPSAPAPQDPVEIVRANAVAPPVARDAAAKDSDASVQDTVARSKIYRRLRTALKRDLAAGRRSDAVEATRALFEL